MTARTMTFRRLPGFNSIDEALAYCVREGLSAIELQKGPDGQIRGTALHQPGARPTDEMLADTVEMGVA